MSTLGVSAQGDVCLGVGAGSVPRGGVSAQGGVCFWSRGCIPAYNGADTPHGQTDTCENVTFANFVCGQLKFVRMNCDLKK